MLALYFLVVVFNCAFVSGYIAKQKGHNYWTWFFFGAFVNAVGVISAAGLPDKEMKKYIKQIAESQNKIEILKE